MGWIILAGLIAFLLYDWSLDEQDSELEPSSAPPQLPKG